MVNIFDIQNNLHNLGLESDEARAFWELTKLDQPTTILKLAKVLKINRTTLYRICDSLVNKNFAHWVISDNGKLIKALKLEKLDFIIESYENQFQNAVNSLNNLKELSKEIVKNIPQTEVRYYQGAEGIKQMIWNTLSAKEVVGYSEFGRIEIVGPSFYNKYVTEFRYRKILDRVISNEKGLNYIKQHVLNPDEKHQLDEINIKIISQEKFYVSGDTSIYGNIYATCYWKEGEVVGVEIENAELVKLHLSIFNILWEIADPLKKYVENE